MPNDTPIQRARAGILRGDRPGYLVLCVVAIVLVGLHTAAYTSIGPKDELQHLDYAEKLGSGHLPRFPEPLGQRAMEEQACRGLDYPLPMPACESERFDSDDFQEGGLSTQTFHPPVYYAVVGPVARGLQELGVVEGTVGVERMLGALLLAAGLCLALATARRLGARLVPSVATLTLVASTQQVVFSHSTVSNDATSLFAGALCLWAVVHARSSWRSYALLAGVGLLAGGTKLTNGFGVGVACLFALLAPWAVARFEGHDRVTLWNRLKQPLVLAGSYLAATVAWQLSFTRRRTASPDDLSIFNRFKPKFLSFEIIANQIPSFAEPFRRVPPPRTVNSSPAFVPDVFAGPLPTLGTFLASLALLAGTYGSWMLFAERRRIATSLGAAVSTLLLLGGPLQFVAVNIATSAGYTETRYAFSMLPGVAIVTALVVNARSTKVIVALATFSTTAMAGVAVAALVR